MTPDAHRSILRPTLFPAILIIEYRKNYDNNDVHCKHSASLLRLMPYPLLMKQVEPGPIGYEMHAMKKKPPEKTSTLQDIREIREKIAALEAAEVRRENAAKVLERAGAELEARIAKQARALKRAEERLEGANNRNRQTDHRVRLLSSAVEQSTEGVSLCDLRGDLVYVNPAFAELHGYTPDELIGKPVATCHTPEQISSVKDADKTLHKAGTFAGEIQHMRRDGTVFASLARSSILKDEAGKEIGVIGTIRDISDLKQATAAHHESEERFDRLLECAPDATLICDAKFSITAANMQACESLGYTQDELLKLTLAEVQEAFDPEEMSRTCEQLEGGALRTIEATQRRKDGSTFSAETKLGLLESGESMRLLVLVRDLAAEREAIAAVKAAQFDLQMRIDEQDEELERARAALSVPAITNSLNTLRTAPFSCSIFAKISENKTIFRLWSRNVPRNCARSSTHGDAPCRRT